VPRRYDLTLTPDLAAATFSGAVDIDVEIGEPTAEVVLNAIELEIDSAWVISEGIRQDATVTLNEDAERVTLTVANQVSSGDAVVIGEGGPVEATQLVVEGAPEPQVHGGGTGGERLGEPQHRPAVVGVEGHLGRAPVDLGQVKLQVDGVQHHL
jgi:hypothetical protein